MQNDYKGSLAYFKRIPSVYLKRDDVALNLATAYYFLGENDKALKALRSGADGCCKVCNAADRAEKKNRKKDKRLRQIRTLQRT